MFRSSKPQFKFKSFKSDAAPFFFFIDVFPLNLEIVSPLVSTFAQYIKNNPIMPLPMRVDRVSNGESSILIRPNFPVSFPINESINAVINPIPFLQSGVENLIYFAEIRSQELLNHSLKPENVRNWWQNTRFLYGNLQELEEDFLAFLKAYLFTMVKAKINEGDITGAAIEYCDMINKICREKMLRNKILVEIDSSQESMKLYQEKKGKYRKNFKIIKKIEYHPELIDIEVYNFLEKNFPRHEDFKNFIRKNHDAIVMKYIPLLMYDDLQECMLQNIRMLEANESELLNPSILLENKIILLLDSDESIDRRKYNWLNDLSKIDIEEILDSLTGLASKK